jgi:predicted nucleic acid-binding protein
MAQAKAALSEQAAEVATSVVSVGEVVLGAVRARGGQRYLPLTRLGHLGLRERTR